MNELSFEIKKLSAEVKHLSSELENLKSLSKMWVNPLAIYSKEIIMKNGSTVFGKIVYQDESELKVETLVGLPPTPCFLALFLVTADFFCDSDILLAFDKGTHLG